MTRTDATVNFDWGNGSPDASVGVDNFSVRWTGQVEAPVSGSYTFSTTSDDGVRLTVNGTQVINDWTDHAPTTDNSAGITLTAGQKYNITMEYYEAAGGAQAKLLWAYPGQAQQAIPTSRLYPTTTTGGGGGGGSTTTITFESATAGNQATSYAESGYTMEDYPGGDPLVVNSTANGYPSNVLINTNWGHGIRIRKTDNTAFNITSFKIGAGTWGETNDAVVTGFYTGGTTVTANASGTTKSLSTVTLNWTGLTKVEINFAGGTNNAYGAIDDITVSSSGAREDVAGSIAESVSIYPNPATGAFIVASAQGATIEIFDIQGQLLVSKKSSGTQVFESSSFSLGVYIVKVTNGADTAVKRLVVE